jgi:hypothetical protein
LRQLVTVFSTKCRRNGPRALGGWIAGVLLSGLLVAAVEDPEPRAPRWEEPQPITVDTTPRPITISPPSTIAVEPLPPISIPDDLLVPPPTLRVPPSIVTPSTIVASPFTIPVPGTIGDEGGNGSG